MPAMLLLCLDLIAWKQTFNHLQEFRVDAMSTDEVGRQRQASNGICQGDEHRG